MWGSEETGRFTMFAAERRREEAKSVLSSRAGPSKLGLQPVGVFWFQRSVQNWACDPSQCSQSPVLFSGPCPLLAPPPC
jgi:hypothetical protein